MNLLAVVFLIFILAVVVPFLVVGAWAWIQDVREERAWRRG